MGSVNTATLSITSTALAAIQAAFTEAGRLALAGSWPGTAG
jgi:hypothetical protein